MYEFIHACKNSNIPNCIHVMTYINSSYSCGIPCEYVVRISDELRHEMIHIQNWKIYASHYNDNSSKLGLELKKAQLDYKLYGEQTGVPITEDIVVRAKRPSVDDLFPYLFEGTSIQDYREALFIGQNDNCIMIREWQTRKSLLKQSIDSTSNVKAMDRQCSTAEFEVTTNLEFDQELDVCVDDILTSNNDDSSKAVTDILNDIYDPKNSDVTPMKKRKLFQYKTPTKDDNELIRFKITVLFLSPTTKQFMRSIKKVSNSVQVVYNKNQLKATCKNIIRTIDHILGHDLVMEDPRATAFVTELDRKVQGLKEEFTKSILLIDGARNEKDGELTFPAFNNKIQKSVDKDLRVIRGKLDEKRCNKFYKWMYEFIVYKNSYNCLINCGHSNVCYTTVV
jgi:hypothetical protein